MVEDRWQEPASRADRALSIAIRQISPAPERNHVIGDYFFASGLSKSLLKLGHRVRIDARPEWDEPLPDNAVVIMLRGMDARPGPASVINLLWYLYPDKKVRLGADDLSRYDHVFFASSHVQGSPEVVALGEKTSVLHQAFDTSVMFCDQSQQRKDVIFIGNNHRNIRNKRLILNLAGETGLNVKLWGRFWEDLPASIQVQDKWLNNADVGNAYRNAEIVLCDHFPSMRKRGFVSNRIFDALACGAPIICDPLPSLPDGFADFVEMVETPEEFRTAVEKIRAEGPEMKAKRVAFAQDMIAKHSFDARARSIVERLTVLGQ